MVSQQLSTVLIQPSLMLKRLQAGVLPQEKREAMVRQMFSEAGCEAAIQPIRKSSSNVICKLPGETDSIVIIGAHYDFVRSGQGIVDDWTGTSLLPSLFEALKTKPRKHTFWFVAFAAEEDGLVGSRRFVKQLTKEQRKDVRAFVNLKCLGITPLKLWLTRSTPHLVDLFVQVTNALGIPPTAVNIELVGDDDTRSFRDVNIPVISFHSVTQDKFPILHSKADNLQAVLPDELFASYRLMAFYFTYLDLKLP